MNITIDINLKASEEVTNSLLTLAAVLHNAVPIFDESAKTIQPKEVERKVEVAKEKIHDKKETIEKTKEETKTITLEEVRAVLAKKSQEGKQKNVKDLITKYGAVKLSEIPSDKYLNLLKEAEMI